MSDDTARGAVGGTRLDEPNRRPGTHHPRLARERALKVLFQADVRGIDPRDLLESLATTRGALQLLDELEPDRDQVDCDAELQLELARRERLPMDDYTRTLVDGVVGHRHAIDELLGDVADRWAVSRMPVVDRNLLRLATYELALQDTPDAVVMDEAVALAGGFAGEKARPFVNGVLETIRKRVVAGEVDLGDDVAVVDVDAASPDDDAVTEPDATGGPPATDAEPDGTGATSATDADPAQTPPPSEDPDAEAAWGEAIDLLGELDADGEPAPPTDDDRLAGWDDPGEQ